MEIQKTKVGAVLGIIGSIILLIVGLSQISFTTMGFYDPGFPAFVYYITAGVTSAVSALGLYGSLMVIRDDHSGYTFLFLAGIAGIVATFIPIYAYDHGYGYIQTFFAGASFGFIDLVLMLVGGILGFALAEKKERKE